MVNRMDIIIALGKLACKQITDKLEPRRAFWSKKRKGATCMGPDETLSRQLMLFLLLSLIRICPL